MMQLQMDFNTEKTFIKREKPLKVLEMFGGIGAPRKALQNIDVEVKSIDYVEILPNAVRAYNAMYDNDYKPQDIRKWNMNVDLLVHGSPCVDFSSAGKNDITTGRSILYERTLEIIEKELHPRPKYVVWENVKGLTFKKHVKHLNHYLKTMEELGYKNYYRILNSLHFGLPQNRERIYVVSIRKDLNKTFDFDELETRELDPLINYLDKDPMIEETNEYTVTQPSMQRALLDGKVYIAINHVATITTKPMRWNTTVVFRDYTNYYVYPRKKDNEMISGIHNRAWKSDKYVGTITATTTPQIATKEDDCLKFRYLTPRECFRLQGFTDEDFDRVLIKGICKTDLYRLAGNSIPVTVLEAIFKELLLREVK